MHPCAHAHALLAQALITYPPADPCTYRSVSALGDQVFGSTYMLVKTIFSGVSPVRRMNLGGLVLPGPSERKTPLRKIVVVDLRRQYGFQRVCLFACCRCLVVCRLLSCFGCYSRARKCSAEPFRALSVSLAHAGPTRRALAPHPTSNESCLTCLRG